MRISDKELKRLSKLRTVLGVLLLINLISLQFIGSPFKLLLLVIFGVGGFGLLFTITHLIIEREKRIRYQEELNRVNKQFFDHLYYLLSKSQSSGIVEQSFKFLGLSQSASEIDIKRQFKQLSLKYHPDMGGTSEKFIQLTKAKDICLQYCSNR